jgi:hypothetical protein
MLLLVEGVGEAEGERKRNPPKKREMGVDV